MAGFSHFLCAKQFLHGRIIHVMIKQRGIKTLKNYANWLESHGFKAVTQSQKPSTIYDYCRSLKRVCAWEGKTIEQLGDSIAEILPMYCATGIHSVRGRMVSRSVRSSLVQLKKFMSESQVA